MYYTLSTLYHKYGKMLEEILKVIINIWKTAKKNLGTKEVTA